MLEKARLGRISEQKAVKYLEKSGYKILCRNFRVKKAEIDIIAEDGPWLVFIEVKARSSGLFGAPEEAVTLKKQRRIMDAARSYMALEKAQRPARFDVIAIGPGGLKHIRDAFETD
ncbi:MAG: YraN family protein [Nitrospiraceae bacterium]|nr:YraN family protein [Nitrospiraceae bacterium]MDA8325559.1 YraN family protein [Nitrospiraceae bacterium]